MKSGGVRMKYAKLMGGLVVATAAMTASLPAWSAVPTENLLGGATASNAYWSQNFLPKIDMTLIDMSYSKGAFKAVSSSSSTFKFTKPDATQFGFKGKLALNATISSTGVFKSGTFAFTSSDSVFGFGKDKYGKAITGNVFKGNLTGFGWSESKGMLEFGSNNFSGWACNMGWCTAAERIKFSTGTNTLGLSKCIQNVTNWSARAKTGTAVVPVPAAAWLLGSGLVGLIGFAKRRKQ